jgi:hypothetical protein
MFMPEALERDLQLYARHEGKPVALVVREAVEAYLVSHRPASRLPSFAGVGASGRTDVAETHESLLFRELDPHQGTATAIHPTFTKPARRRRVRKVSSPRR